MAILSAAVHRQGPVDGKVTITEERKRANDEAGAGPAGECQRTGPKRTPKKDKPRSARGCNDSAATRKPAKVKVGPP